MKKSQLRNIIRESIKQLMTEQSYTGGIGTMCNIKTCSGGLSSTFCVPNSAYPNGVQIGDHFKIDEYFDQLWNGPLTGRHVFVRTVGASGCQAGGNTTLGAVWTTITPLTSCCQNCTDPSDWNPLPFPSGGCTTSCTTPPASGCDQSAWSNYTNWSNNWTNLGPFNSSNPNQPCNFICNKIQDFTNNLVGAGPVQTNQLNCKLDVANQQSQIHNCTC